MPNTPSATHEQIEALLNFMEENPCLARGLLRGADGRMRAKRLWEDMCNFLNSMGGCTKSMEQWQRVWADRKHTTKKAAGAARRSACATGGGPSEAPALSQVELKILSIMGEGFGEPQTEARVPAFPWGPPEDHLPAPTAILPTEAHSEQTSTLSTEASSSSVHNVELPTTQNQATINPRRVRPRARRYLTADSSRLRIVELEELRLQAEIERNEELRQIKGAIIELFNLIKEYISKK